MPEGHLTQRELVLLLDGEFNDRAGHIATCPFCRERLQELDTALSDFVALHRDSLERELPCATAARARIETAMRRAQPSGKRKWEYAVAALAACLALLVVLSGSSDRSEPIPKLTPGETRSVSVSDVCRDDRGDSARIVPVSLQQQVFHAYGISDTRPGAYEVDYLITPELGGADSIRNLWPEPYSSIWNARVKDALEQRLHEMVCAGQVDLATAQRDISRDWIAAYKKYFHRARPEELVR